MQGDIIIDRAEKAVQTQAAGLQVLDQFDQHLKIARGFVQKQDFDLADIETLARMDGEHCQLSKEDLDWVQTVRSEDCTEFSALVARAAYKIGFLVLSMWGKAFGSWVLANKTDEQRAAEARWANSLVAIPDD